MRRRFQVRRRSGLEDKVEAQLKENKVKYGYETEKLAYRKRVPSGVCGECPSKDVYQNHKYTPDFILENGIRLEVKGRLTSSDRTKMIAVKKDNPGLDIRFVFGSNNKLTKASEVRYSDWSEKHGFLYCLKEVPLEWMK